MKPFEFRQIINYDRSCMLQCGSYISNRFIYPMYKHMLARHTARDCNGDLSFASAIQPQFVFLSPLGDGFAEEGFACVGDL
jgi:hypothetical protein